jgi:glycosyl transferase, family 25
MRSLPELFGAAYLINLPERVDRLKSAKRQLARAHWRIGTDGVEIFPALRFAEPAGFLNVAVRGCFHSHLECLRRAHVDGRRNVLILEDDIGLTSSLPRLTSSIESQLAVEKWDFVYFGHGSTGDIPSANRHTEVGDVKFDLWTNDILGAHFYAVSGRILPRLLEYLSKIPNGRSGDPECGPMVPDGAYNVFRRNNRDVRCLIVHPKLGWQSSSRSDLTPHPLDRIVILRPINTALRRLKQFGMQWDS